MSDRPQTGEIETRDFTTIERRGPVALVRYDRKDGLNALSRAAMRELTDIARMFNDDISTHVIVLTGTDKIFSAGADLAWMKEQASLEPAAISTRQSVVTPLGHLRPAMIWIQTSTRP